MHKSQLTAAGAAMLAAVALAVAGCGGGSSGYSAPSTSVSSASSQASAIDVRSTPLGKILVDTTGRTLYLFEADKPNVSNCSGACLSLWPAFTSNAKPEAKGSAVAAKIGTIATSDGTQQVTYNGHPLYYYAADQKPGDITGQGLDQFGGVWDVLAPTGNGIDDD